MKSSRPPTLKSFENRRFYTFIDIAYLRGRSPASVAALLCEGGADVVQIRAKDLSQGEVLQMAESVKPITDRASVALVINDFPAVARQVEADAVHLGQEDFFNAGHKRAEEVTGAPASIGLGLSTHSPDQAARATAAGSDYIAIGPVFATPTKPGRPPVTLDYVRWAAENVKVPWFAIGGITLKNLDDVLAAGATRICAVSAILNADDPVKACREFAKRLGSRP
jgi:thiamine-phosphate pyrophosphorylase